MTEEGVVAVCAKTSSILVRAQVSGRTTSVLIAGCPFATARIAVMMNSAAIVISDRQTSIVAADVGCLLVRIEGPLLRKEAPLIARKATDTTRDKVSAG